jgi:hypothetical protein
MENGGFSAEFRRQQHSHQMVGSSNIHILSTGDGNLINTGSHNTIHTNFNNAKGNVAELQEALKKNRVANEDILEISEIVTADVPQQQVLGPKANGWILKMLSKSLDGTWELGIATAGGVLTEIIKKFYGL